jgi:hypothetical protein
MRLCFMVSLGRKLGKVLKGNKDTRQQKKAEAY